MGSEEEFHQKSYRQHAAHFHDYARGGRKEAHAKMWFDEDSVDAWRHRRMYEMLDPILEADPKARWLTVGDGRYGKDARYILGKGCNALATDISDVLLKEAKDLGYIHDFRKENAELLSFSDAEFDYVFCKESYHHFPRPMLAFYEMLRVADRGVVLIEPNDAYVCNSFSKVLSRNTRDMIKAMLGKTSSKHSFEESGNYLFSISRREIEKVALGMNYRIVAFKGINDTHRAGVEYEKLSDNGALYKKVKTRISLLDLLTRLGLRDYGLLAAIIFKQKPHKDLLHRLRNFGYEISNLPDNPYISG